jgi:hypothetical protein
MELVLIGTLSWAAACLGVVGLCRAAARGDAVKIVAPARRVASARRPRRRCAAERASAQLPLGH